MVSIMYKRHMKRVRGGVIVPGEYVDARGKGEVLALVPASHVRRREEV